MATRTGSSSSGRPSAARSGDARDAGRNWTMAEKVLAFFGALITLAASILGLITAQIVTSKEKAEQAAAVNQSELRALQDRFATLEQRNNALETENAALRARAGLPGPTAEPTPGAGVTVRHQGQLVLAFNGEEADLDSPQSNAQWDTDLGGPEIRYAGRYLIVSTTALQLGSRQADYHSCSGTTGYTPANIETRSVAVGDYLCIRTSDDRFAALRITQLDDRTVTFDVVVYDPPS